MWVLFKVVVVGESLFLMSCFTSSSKPPLTANSVWKLIIHLFNKYFFSVLTCKEQFRPESRLVRWDGYWQSTYLTQMSPQVQSSAVVKKKITIR